MLRNREILVFAVAAAILSTVAAIICFSFHPGAGIVCLLGCLCIFAVCLIFTFNRYRKIAKLADYLSQLTSGKPALDIRENVEGELSILKNEIYKATITMQEQAESLHKDKLELSTALSDISHQLKTPLTSLGIMADLLEDNNLPFDKRREFISSMRERLSKMEWLVLSLLKLARLDADAVTLKKISVSLSKLVEKALSPMLVPLEIKNQTYAITGEAASVICDPDWTVEAIGNIIKNAVENTPEGGHIELSYGTNPLYAYIIVRDSGPGIDKGDLPHLFKRFYRGKSANRDSVGIGLAMSLAILRRQGGDIGIANDSGSVFTLKFYHNVDPYLHEAD